MSNYLVKNGALIFLIQFLLYSASSHAQEYMYPVAAFSDDSIGFIHQATFEKIELYKWNYLTKAVEPSLPSRFCPAHITMLPDSLGFSFIDNGIIRIKFSHKRSPKSLEITEPIYNINGVFWEKENNLVHGYFSAQYQDHYALVRIDLDGHITHIIFSKTSDFLYPQKAGDNLLFIARSIENTCVHYNLCKIKFDSYCDSRELKITDQEQEHSEIKKTIHTEIGASQLSEQLSEITFLDFGTQPICFLVAEDQKKEEINAVGYVVAYVSHTESLVTFAYYQISQDSHDPSVAQEYPEQERMAQASSQDIWSKKKLFDFVLPTSFLFTQGPNQLYEHIAPLLPKKIGNSIYFSHTTHSDLVFSDPVKHQTERLENQPQNNSLIAPESNINIFSYNLATQDIEQVTHACDPGEHFFCPLKVGNELYYGGATHGQ